ncbi:hypothetical protein HKX48_008771 [Thoreauomyces humboldtii]|nr:hypothetical protein HKX48_008771 [Thoreauomyces humboldtii]
MQEMGKDLDIAVEDADMEDLYAALNAPVQTSSSLTGPGAAAALKLDPDYLSRLYLKFTNSGEEKMTALQTTREKAVRQAASQLPNLVDISRVIQVNALTQRPQEAQQAFDMISLNNLEPDLIAYNHLMDAYCRANDLEAVQRLFGEVLEKNLKPDIITYGILVHAHIRKRELNAAFKVYEDMKKSGVQPSQHIFSSLMKGCIQANDIKRAWATFDHMRSEFYQPDAISYSLMIAACAKGKEAERALDLFQEMAQNGLSPTEVTFTALIKACGSRSDYYLEAFQLLEQMVAEGFLPNTHTYNVLFQAAAGQGDVARARMIWNDMMDRYDAAVAAANGNEAAGRTAAYRPTEWTFIHLFQCYARAINVARRPQKANGTAKGVANASDDLETAAPPNSANIESVGDVEQAASEPPPSPSGADTPPTSAAATEESAPLAPSALVESSSSSSLRLTSTSSLPRDLLAETRTLWTYLTTGGPDSQTLVPITTRLLDVYFDILSTRTAYSRANHYQDAILPFHSTAYTSHGLQPTGQSRSSLLTGVTRDRNLMRSEGLNVWKDILAWDAEREKALEGPMKQTDRERSRELEGRGASHMFRNFVRVVNGLVRIGDVDGALSTIHQASVFRHPGYLPQVQFKDVYSLVEKARSMAEDGRLGPAKRLLELCPTPRSAEGAAVDEVRRRLKVASVGGDNWWGWKALGMDEQKKIRQEAYKRNRRKTQQTAKVVRKEGMKVPRSTGFAPPE